MSLPAGTRLGPYEIVSPLGAGGMGEVYKARDTRLDRDVALKVLPSEVQQDADRQARFEREAKAISQLTHPNICTLHDIGSTSSPQAAGGQTIHYLVMELLEGETLAARLECPSTSAHGVPRRVEGRGPLPLAETLRLGAEIASALEAAHRRGIVHRDLKPANVMLMKTGPSRSSVGTAKLLDFGLAKLRPVGPVAVEATAAPTRMGSATAQGTLLGTLPYMAPEQVEGRDADARTDIWALGCVLYEMAAGRRAFGATSQASLIGEIMAAEPPPLTATQPLTPPAFDRLVRTCLAKDPEERWQSARDVRRELQWLREAGPTKTAAVAVPLHPLGSLRLALLAAAALALLAAGAGLTWVLRPPAAAAPVAQLSLDVRPAEEMNAGGQTAIPGTLDILSPRVGTHTSLTWTPDGQALVFVGRRAGVQQLYVRRLDAREARPLQGTEGAQVPAVSMDGQWVAFWAGGAIKKVPLHSGPVVTLMAGLVYLPLGLVWGADERLFFGRDDKGIWSIPPDGSSPKPVTTIRDGELRHVLSAYVPGGRALIYTVRKREWTWGDEQVVAQPLDGGDRIVLLKNAVDARYVSATGHLVFLRRGVLCAVRFDVTRLAVAEREVPVMDGIAQALVYGDSAGITGAGQFAIAPTGTLAWVDGPLAAYPNGRPVTIDRRGQETPLPAPERSYLGQRLSPDGRRLALVIATLDEFGLWVYDLERGGEPTPLNRVGESGESAIWTPDGRTLVFSWLHDGRHSLAWQAADVVAPGASELAPGKYLPASFLRDDGRQFAAVPAVTQGNDPVIATLENGKASLQSMWTTKQNEYWPEFSPDGRWLAYGTDASGRFEVRVRSYPDSKWDLRISLDGGWSPAWNPHGGREIFFIKPPDTAGMQWIMAAEFTPGEPPIVGRPRELFKFDERELPLACYPNRCYDVAPKGDKFYGLRWPPASPRPPVTHINVAVNWVEELKEKVRGKQ